jgi:hypothetical protein
MNKRQSLWACWVGIHFHKHNFKGQISTKYIEMSPLFKLKIQDITSDSRSITTADSSFGYSMANFYLHNSLTKDKTVRLSAYQFLGSFAMLRKAPISFNTSICLSVCPSVCPSVYPSVCSSVRPPACNHSALAGKIFTKFGIWGFLRKSIHKI